MLEARLSGRDHRKCRRRREERKELRWWTGMGRSIASVKRVHRTERRIEGLHREFAGRKFDGIYVSTVYERFTISY